MRGYFGVQPQDVDEQLAKSMELPNTSGALKSQVVPDGPAAKAGLQVGDSLRRSTTSPWQTNMSCGISWLRSRPARRRKWSTTRQGKPQTAEVELGKMPELDGFGPMARRLRARWHGKFGLKLDALTPNGGAASEAAAKHPWRAYYVGSAAVGGV